MRVSSTLIVALSVAFAASAARADGGYFAPNPGAAPADFSGFDIGIDAGAALGSVQGQDISSYAAGGHIGYNLQNGPLVGGFNLTGLFENPSTSVGTASFTANSIGSLRGRGGYAFGNVLVFGSLGWAISGTQFSNAFGADYEAMTGYIVGIGAEYAITRTVSARVQFDHYGFDPTTYNLPTGSVKIGSSSQNLLTLGVAVHF